MIATAVGAYLAGLSRARTVSARTIDSWRDGARVEIDDAVNECGCGTGCPACCDAETWLIAGTQSDPRDWPDAE